MKINIHKFLSEIKFFITNLLSFLLVDPTTKSTRDLEIMKIKNKHKQRPFIDTVIAEMSQLSLSPPEECENETCEDVKSKYDFLECVDKKNGRKHQFIP